MVSRVVIPLFKLANPLALRASSLDVFFQMTVLIEIKRIFFSSPCFVKYPGVFLYPELSLFYGRVALEHPR